MNHSFREIIHRRVEASRPAATDRLGLADRLAARPDRLAAASATAIGQAAIRALIQSGAVRVSPNPADPSRVVVTAIAREATAPDPRRSAVA